jgi:deferrochelatase/peroxidase EfeB
LFLLRRGYSFTDGIDPQTGQLDAGLFFLAYQRDPRNQFIPLQSMLAKQDALNEYIQHVSSGIYAVPPGSANAGEPIGDGLFI